MASSTSFLSLLSLGSSNTNGEKQAPGPKPGNSSPHNKNNKNSGLGDTTTTTTHQRSAPVTIPELQSASPASSSPSHSVATTTDGTTPSSSSSFPLQLGTPVWVKRSGQPVLEGVVAYLGPVEFSHGHSTTTDTVSVISASPPRLGSSPQHRRHSVGNTTNSSEWVGVQLTGISTSQGKHNGTVQGRTYFVTELPYAGLFVRRHNLLPRTTTYYPHYAPLAMTRTKSSRSVTRTRSDDEQEEENDREEENLVVRRTTRDTLAWQPAAPVPLGSIVTSWSGNSVDHPGTEVVIRATTTMSLSTTSSRANGTTPGTEKTTDTPTGHGTPAATPSSASNGFTAHNNNNNASPPRAEAARGVFHRRDASTGPAPRRPSRNNNDDDENAVPVHSACQVGWFCTLTVTSLVPPACVAALLVCYYYQWNPLVHFRGEDPPDDRDDDDDTPIKRLLKALPLYAAGLLAGQIVASGALLLPLLAASVRHTVAWCGSCCCYCFCCCCTRGRGVGGRHPVTTPLAWYMGRTSALLSAWMGLTQLLLTLWIGQDDTASDDTATTTTSTLLDSGLDGSIQWVPLLLWGSGGSALLATLALMISFWPPLTTTAAAALQPVSVVTRQEPNNNNNNPLLEPLLSSTAETTTDSVDEEVGQSQLPDEEEAQPEGTAAMDDGNATPEAGGMSRMRGTGRLLQLASSQTVYLYLGCIVLLIRLPFSLSIPHFVSTTLAALGRADYHQAHQEIMYLLILGTVDAALDFWCIFLFGYANQRIVREVRLDLFSRLLGMEVAFFDQHNSGTLASRLNSDCSEMAGDLTWFFRFSIESIVRITGITAYMLIRSPKLGACALTIVPVVAVVNKLYGDWLRDNAIAVQDALAEANAVAQEALYNVRTVIAFAAETLEEDHYGEKIQRQYELNIRQLYMQGVYYMAVSTFLINTLVQAALLWYGTTLIRLGELTPEVLLAFMLYQGQLQSYTLNLFQSYSSLIKSSGAGDKVFALLDRQPPPPATGSTPDEGSLTPLDNPSDDEPTSYDLFLQNVSFSYPTRPTQKALDRISLNIPKGSTVALVGHSGCGKSTVVNLLQRFYDPSGGSIQINGRDLKTYDLKRHRRRIGLVSQDCVLFDGTVLDNITYGSRRRQLEQGNEAETHRLLQEATRAAKLAHADEFVRRLPEGYNTSVGEKGVQLSGGQRQRLSIARAIYQQPLLLILDEATSALDQESEKVVQQALDELLQLQRNQQHTTIGTTTTLVIAHRLHTIENADYIAVLEHGQLVEWGAPKELIRRPEGRYRGMVERAQSTGRISD